MLSLWFRMLCHSVRSLTMFRTNFFMSILSDLGDILFTIIFFECLYSSTGFLGGWDRGRVYFLILSCQLVNSLYSFFFSANIHRMMLNILNGFFDFDIIHPAGIWFSCFWGRVSLQSFPKVLSSIFLLLVIYFSYSLNFHFLNAVLFVISIILAFIIRGFFSFLMGQATFYVGHFPALQSFFDAFFSLSVFPESFFKGYLVRVLFFSIVPVFLVGNVPVAIIFGENQGIFLAVLLSVLVFLFLCCKFHLSYAIKKYVSASA